MDKEIEELNKKYSCKFEDKGNGKYTFFLPPSNWITIDINTKIIDSKNWYGGENTNGKWNDQPRKEQKTDGLIHNLLSINQQNRDTWKPPY